MTTPPPTPDTTRESIDRAVGSVLFNVRNFPESAQSRLLGRDMGPLREKLTEAVAAALSAYLPEPDTDLDASLAWADYRKDYEPNPAHFAREHVAFSEGFRVGRAARTVETAEELAHRLLTALHGAGEYAKAIDDDLHLVFVDGAFDLVELARVLLMPVPPTPKTEEIDRGQS